jgi:hypothetical protein
MGIIIKKNIQLPDVRHFSFTYNGNYEIKLRFLKKVGERNPNGLYISGKNLHQNLFDINLNSIEDQWETIIQYIVEAEYTNFYLHRITGHRWNKLEEPHITGNEKIGISKRGTFDLWGRVLMLAND